MSNVMDIGDAVVFRILGVNVLPAKWICICVNNSDAICGMRLLNQSNALSFNRWLRIV